MPLNITFAGDLYDENNNPLNNVRAWGWHKESNTWSGLYDFTGEAQYNMNLGDGQWLTQDGHVNNPGDTVLIKFETTEDNPLDRRFCLYEIQLDGNDVYTQDVQLIPCQPPNVSWLWHLQSPTDGATTFDNTAAGGSPNTYIGRINEAITAVDDGINDEYEWTFSGANLMHVVSRYGQDIFSDRLGIVSKEYDWTNDDVFVTDNTHTFTAISSSPTNDTPVEIKVTNKKGQVVTDILAIQIRYNSPIPDVTWSPENPSVTDTFTITGNIQDPDGRITNIAYKFDGELVANTTDPNYSWTQDLGTEYQETHTVNSDVSWNDGFSDLFIEHQETIYMTNLAPTFDLVYEVIGDPENNDLKFTAANLTDPDGDDNLLELKWMIEYKTPFDNTYKVVYNPGYPATPDLTSKEWIFNTQGDYRVTATAKDGYGLETSHSVIVSFDTGATYEGKGKIKLNNNVWQLIAIPV